MDREHPREKVTLELQQQPVCQDSTGSQRYSMKHLLADWAILLAGYDGKVTSDSSQAGEDLKQEQETTTLSGAQTHI